VAYFADFTPYCYIAQKALATVLNVGWLDDLQQLPKRYGPCSGLGKGICTLQASRKPDARLALVPVLPELGLGQLAERDGLQIRLGSREIRIKGLQGVEYASPTMIYHYRNAHSYLPPHEFIEAVSSTQLNLSFTRLNRSCPTAVVFRSSFSISQLQGRIGPERRLVRSRAPRTHVLHNDEETSTMKLGRFATRFMVALVLMSVCPWRVLAQDHGSVNAITKSPCLVPSLP
jgi:hypothetical protein